MVEKNGAKRGRPAGWSLTEDLKRKMREGREKAKQGEVSIVDGGEWKRLFLLRGAYPKTIARLSDSPQNNNGENSFQSARCTKSIDFAKGLLSQGLISEDLTDWKFLISSYRKSGRKFPASFFDMLRLEVYCRGIREALEGDMKSLNLYTDTGYVIYRLDFDKSLADEEDFVASLMCKTPEVANVDGSGYFTVRDGILGRPVVFGTGDRMRGDSPRQAILRKIFRERKPES